MTTNFILILSLLCLYTQINEVQTLNILGLFPYQGKSHFFVFQTYLEELAQRGHNVTVVSYFPRKEPLKNYHDISLAGKSEILQDVFEIERSLWSIIKFTLFMVNSGTENCRTLLGDENVQNLWKTKAKFDVVVIEQFNSDCSLGLAYKLGAPVVGITSHLILPWHYKRFGIPYNPSFVPLSFLEGGSKPTLYQRTERTLFYVYLNVLYKYMSQRIDQNTLAQHFDDVPPLEELAKEMKFMIIYTNIMLFGSYLYPANVIEVNGYHVANPEPLPEELRKFIDESEHGVIYVSFGSMLKAASTPKDKLEAIIGALAKFPQRVIWKWEENTLPGNPKNFYISKWLPQNDILAHPKVLAFYSHCGLLGTTEAIYHGVPMVGMPIFGGQPTYAAAVEESGLGVQIQITELTTEKLTEKFKTVLDPEFGIPYNPSFVPLSFLEGGSKPTLYQRTERTLFYVYLNVLYKYMSQRIDQNTLAQHFDDVPPLEELAKEMKFMIIYTNIMLFGSYLYPANVIEVNGYHVANPEPLPEELRKFIDESEHGVIYVSFGSMLKAASTPKDKLEAIIGALAKFPQRVIWKWEENTLPGNPKNFYISKWLPQNDILAHPKVLAFYSHCGLLGTTEAIYHGVPMVGMPIFGGQPTYAAAVEESGLGVQIQITELTTEKLTEKFKTVLDPEFRARVEALSKAWRDRPIPPIDSAIYWTEFAAHHKNFTFRAAAADVPLNQYLCLDILGVFVLMFSGIIFVLKSLFSKSKKSKLE